ncbi:MAG: phytoene/squalene synthase family protein [Flavobacterium sp.]
MKSLFDQSSLDCCKKVTTNYSTSFSLAIKMLSPKIQNDIYAIYGFVRLADEIVDTFEGYNQEKLLTEFELDYYKALEDKISLNPILNSFQEVVLRNNIQDLVLPFLKSMRMDLHKTIYATQKEYEDYIYGSADVVGLMCLKVFVEGDEKKYEDLKYYAMKLGSAFQKVNFLRDMNHDFNTLGRTYFPGLNFKNLTLEDKYKIIQEIDFDFQEALIGIKLLPTNARFGVFTAYKYYKNLLLKIKKTHYTELLKKRIRINNLSKIVIMGKSYVRYQLNLLM